VVVVFAVIQTERPSESNNTISELLVMASFTDEWLEIGLSRLAIHTTVHSGMLLYQIPRYKLLLDLVGEKKPRAKTPPSDMTMLPGESEFSCVTVSWSLDSQKELKIKNRRKKTWRLALPIMFFSAGLFASEG
jgi:hypothetical protein